MRKLLLISMLVTAIVQPVLGQGAEIRPEHARILDDAGWLDFVLENCDEVRYYDSTSLNVGGEGPYVGLAEFRNDRRIVHIATKNRSDVQIAEVLAHEAGHLSGLNIGNALADEATAEEHAERFRRDYRIAQARLGNDASDGTVPVQAPVGPAGWLGMLLVGGLAVALVTRTLPRRGRQGGADADYEFIKEGVKMAGQHGQGVFEAIDKRPESDRASWQTTAASARGEGRHWLERVDELRSGRSAGSNLGEHLRNIAPRRTDLRLASATPVSKEFLAVLVLLGFGSVHPSEPGAAIQRTGSPLARAGTAPAVRVFRCRGLRLAGITLGKAKHYTNSQRQRHGHGYREREWSKLGHPRRYK